MSVCMRVSERVCVNERVCVRESEYPYVKVRVSVSEVIVKGEKSN